MSGKTVKQGSHEGHAVQWNDFEAWWYINDEWCWLNPGEAVMNARILTKEEYQDRFGQLPPLPTTAFRPRDKVDGMDP